MRQHLLASHPSQSLALFCHPTSPSLWPNEGVSNGCEISRLARSRLPPIVIPDQLVKQKEPRKTNSSRPRIENDDAEERPIVRTRRAHPVTLPRLNRATCRL